MVPRREACKAEMTYREQVRAAVNKAMDAQKIDAWVYPTWSNPPRLIGDLEHARRRQQPVLLADHGLPVDPGADGLHARRTLARRHHVLRPRVVGAGADQIRVRLRAGDASSSPTGKHAAATLNEVQTRKVQDVKIHDSRRIYGDQRTARAVLHVGAGEAARDAARRVRLQITSTRAAAG